MHNGEAVCSSVCLPLYFISETTGWISVLLNIALESRSEFNFGAYRSITTHNLTWNANWNSSNFPEM